MTTLPEGSVRSLWRYPVRSILGEEIESCEVTPRGLAGDRAYALVDARAARRNGPVPAVRHDDARVRRSAGGPRDPADRSTA
ncbi:MAG TPA: MOSC N-terminal beta barrel domain-containing protein [Thermoanaerobaculia bacterium]|jgi:uncharacterized protein YcbX|nr:MOSC N-terminal beta barrel domain-containing protein [Thermoanaerobaculia bacterium]